MHYPLPPELPGAGAQRDRPRCPQPAADCPPSRGSGPGRRRKAPLGAGTAAAAGGTRGQRTPLGTQPRTGHSRAEQHRELTGRRRVPAGPGVWKLSESRSHRSARNSAGARGRAPPGRHRLSGLYGAAAQPRSAGSGLCAGLCRRLPPEGAAEPRAKSPERRRDAALTGSRHGDGGGSHRPPLPCPGGAKDTPRRRPCPRRGGARGCRGAPRLIPHPSSLSPARRDARPSPLRRSGRAGGRLPRRSHQLRFPLRYLSQDGMGSPPAAEALSQCNKCPPGRGGRRRRGGGRGAAAQRSGRPGCHSPRRAPSAAARPPPPRARARARSLGPPGTPYRGPLPSSARGGAAPPDPLGRCVGPAGGGAVSPGRARWWRPAAIGSGGAARWEPLAGPRRCRAGAGLGAGPAARLQGALGPGSRTPQLPPGRACRAGQRRPERGWRSAVSGRRAGL
ncbi:spidroin-2-like [Anomalospiza imberbis]|uniref:spidroin-2-like n=1 Tax=Anomalospiza imberbis TaxID=187417 RepID=UPI00358F8E9F